MKELAVCGIVSFFSILVGTRVGLFMRGSSMPVYFESWNAWYIVLSISIILGTTLLDYYVSQDRRFRSSLLKMVVLVAIGLGAVYAGALWHNFSL